MVGMSTQPIQPSFYEAIGGHETVRDRYCEDVEIARLVKDIQQLKETSTKLEAEMQEIRDAE